MISYVKTASHREALAWKLGDPAMGIDAWIAQRKPRQVWMISILGYGEQPLAKVGDLEVSFTDIDLDMFAAHGIETKDTNTFDRKKAEKIIRYTRMIHTDLKPLDRRDGLLIHCNAGWSRSVAVAHFVREFCGVDRKIFEEDVRSTGQNPYVLRILRETAMESQA